MEDPLFDPWGEIAEAARPEAPRGDTESAVSDVVQTPPAGVAPRDSAEREPSADRESSGQPPKRWRPVPTGTAPRVRPAPRLLGPPLEAGPAAPEAPDHPLPARAGVDSLTATCALPALQALASRLELARHEVRIDDRSHGQPASVRFQIRPWAGPLEEASDHTAPVLEIVDGPDGDQLVVRTWLEPTASEPSMERVVPAEVAERGLRRALIDFVEVALR